MAKQESVMRNVKVGDIAIVVDGGYKRERQGMVVKVVAFKGRMSYEGSWLQPAWLIQAYGARPFGYEIIDGRTRPLSIVLMPDAYLRRLAPDQAKTDLLVDEESDIKRRKLKPDVPLNLTNLQFDPAAAAGEASIRMTQTKSRRKK
jgi:hypothetical protein